MNWKPCTPTHFNPVAVPGQMRMDVKTHAIEAMDAMKAVTDVAPLVDIVDSTTTDVPLDPASWQVRHMLAHNTGPL